MRPFPGTLALALWCLAAAPRASAYSVLTHEAIIDTSWDSIAPVLLAHFPGTTPDQLVEAHSYAYGGCIIQDMGYYPFGSKFFSDLVHYVRSGDFVEALLRQAQDVNEYAFALGALAHYVADVDGHSVAVNPSVPLLYPKLRREFGDWVTYAENPAAHMKTEFGFDVLQVARGAYAPPAYHDFIGFHVSKPVLERAFRQIYGLELPDVFASVDLALGTYRLSVSKLIPESTRVAWVLKKDELEKLSPGIKESRFIYRLTRRAYEKEWGKDYRKPGIGARILAFVIRVIPKVGPFRSVSFKPPTPTTERLFLESFNRTVISYRALLTAAKVGRLDLRNVDFDTGRPTRAGEYELADKTYAEVLRRLAEHNFQELSQRFRSDLLAFFANPEAPNAAKRDRKKWRETVAALHRLQSWPAAATNADREAPPRPVQ